jgi:UDPglucose 6-dehydrogenase
MMMMMKLAVVGSGYVGNVTGACFASMGHHVVIAGLEAERIEKLQQGHISFYEEGLESMVQSELASGKLRYSFDITEACSDVEVVFLCVTAPPKTDGTPDLRPIEAVIAPMVQTWTEGYKLLVERSNLPVGFHHWLKDFIQTHLPEGSTCEVELAAVPQFLREGQAIHDFYQPDRLVIGAETQKAKELLTVLHDGISAPLLLTDITSAEMIKHATNAYLATKISFINTIALLCEKTGADIQVVSKGLGMDNRISPHFLNAGLGYGGIFLPRDIQSLQYVATKHHMSLDILKATQTVNRYQRINFIERIEAACGGSLVGKTVAVWGLAYRPNTDDMRDTPSVQIIWGLQNRGATIRAYDPIAMPASKDKVRKVTFCKDMYEAAEGADVIAVLTEWPEFAAVNLSVLKERSACRLMVDGRNLFVPTRLQEQGFTYHCIGRPERSHSL